MTPMKEDTTTNSIKTESISSTTSSGAVANSVAQLLPYSNATHVTMTSGDSNGANSNMIRTLELHGHVGFDALPHQLVKKAVDQGCVYFSDVCLSFFCFKAFNLIFFVSAKRASARRH